MFFGQMAIKIHPLIHSLREEFSFDPQNLQKSANENFWFCLKPEKRLEYLRKKNIFPPKPIEKDEPHFVKGFARKSGKAIEKENNNKVLESSERIGKTKKKLIGFLQKKKQKATIQKEKKFVIKIDD